MMRSSIMGFHDWGLKNEMRKVYNERPCSIPWPRELHYSLRETHTELEKQYLDAMAAIYKELTSLKNIEEKCINKVVFTDDELRLARCMHEHDIKSFFHEHGVYVPSVTKAHIELLFRFNYPNPREEAVEFIASNQKTPYANVLSAAYAVSPDIVRRGIEGFSINAQFRVIKANPASPVVELVSNRAKQIYFSAACTDASLNTTFHPSFGVDFRTRIAMTMLGHTWPWHGGQETLPTGIMEKLEVWPDVVGVVREAVADGLTSELTDVLKLCTEIVSGIHRHCPVFVQVVREIAPWIPRPSDIEIRLTDYCTLRDLMKQIAGDIYRTPWLGLCCGDDEQKKVLRKLRRWVDMLDKPIDLGIVPPHVRHVVNETDTYQEARERVKALFEHELLFGDSEALLFLKQSRSNTFTADIECELRHAGKYSYHLNCSGGDTGYIGTYHTFYTPWLIVQGYFVDE